MQNKTKALEHIYLRLTEEIGSLSAPLEDALTILSETEIKELPLDIGSCRFELFQLKRLVFLFSKPLSKDCPHYSAAISQAEIDLRKEFVYLDYKRGLSEEDEPKRWKQRQAGTSEDMEEIIDTLFSIVTSHVTMLKREFKEDEYLPRLSRMMKVIMPIVPYIKTLYSNNGKFRDYFLNEFEVIWDSLMLAKLVSLDDRTCTCAACKE